MASPVVRVLVMAPQLGPDLTYVSEVDARVDVLDGNLAFGAELVEQGRARGPSPTGAPFLEERDQLLGGRRRLVGRLSRPAPAGSPSSVPPLGAPHAGRRVESSSIRSLDVRRCR